MLKFQLSTLGRAFFLINNVYLHVVKYGHREKQPFRNES